MKKVKVKVLLPFVSGKTSFGGGDEISLDQDVAYKLTKKGVVEFQVKKEFTDLDSEIVKADAEAKAKQEEDDAKVKAILEQGVIQNDLNELYLAVVLKEAELNGEVLSDEEVTNAVESIAKRDAVATKKAKGK